jgi:hypothetical protein
VNFENLVQGGVVFGLGHAMNCEITYSDGRAQQENYYDHEAMRIHNAPRSWWSVWKTARRSGHRGAARPARCPRARQRDLRRDGSALRAVAQVHPDQRELRVQLAIVLGSASCAKL